MRQPTIRDSGQTVELDLHGASIRDAVILLRRTLLVSVQRGRSSVKVIHGYSTSVDPRRHLSIRDELYDLLDEGTLTEVQSHHRFDGSTILLLGHFDRTDQRRITMYDITSQW